MSEYRSSASQVATAELCLRKWAGLKIEKIEVPPNRFAKAGTETHGYLADWFTDGTPPPNNNTGKTAQAILVHLPPPNTPGLEVEERLSLMLGGVEFLGFVDLRNLALPVPFVSDHKTTSGLQWAKEPDDLVDDVQATLYAYDAMCLSGKRAVDLQWTYGTRHKRPQTKPVRRHVTFDEIKHRLDKTAATAAMLAEIHAASPYWLDVPYDAGGCETFGGCPFRDDCNLSPQERIQSIMSQETQHSAFLAKLRGKRGKRSKDGDNGAQPQPHPAPVNPPSAPEPAAKTRKKRKTKAQKEAEAAAQAAAPETPAASTHCQDAARAVAAVAAPQSPAKGSTASVGTRTGPPVEKPAAAPVAQVAGNVLDMLNAQFVAGFKAGYREGRDA